MLGKVSSDFHNLVIGPNEEPTPRVLKPNRQVASSKAKARVAEPEAEQVAMTTEVAVTEVVSAPAMAVAPPESAAPGPYATVDNGGTCSPGLVAGPAGRFFPVPARPVFSPQYGPQYGGCELR